MECALARISQRVNAFWRAEASFFLGIWLFFMVGVRERLFRDPGTFWHATVGSQILRTGRFPDTDWLSFTRAGDPWIPHQWLAECLMAVFDRLGGLDLLLLATATILSATYAWVAQRLLRCGLHWLPTALLTMLTIAASASHLHARPHLGTIVLLGVTFAWLCDFEAGRKRLNQLAWLVPLFWAWSNLHGGVLAGMAVLTMLAAGWSVLSLIGWSSPLRSPGQGAVLFLLIVACGLSFVVNPYGIRLPMSWMEILGSPAVARLIEEHAPLDPRAPDSWLILALGLVYFGVLVSVRPWRLRWTWLIPPLLLWQTFFRVRHAPLFAITAALAMAEMLPFTALARFLARPGRDLFELAASRQDHEGRGSSPPGFAWKSTVIPAGIVFLSLLLQTAGLHFPVLGRGWMRLDPDHWPVELIDDLRKLQGTQNRPARIFNEFLDGGFLIYHAPGLKVFIDDRCELYGDDRLKEFFEAMNRNPVRVDDWTASYGIEYAMVRTGSAFDGHLKDSGRWREIRRTKTAVLYEQLDRKGGEPWKHERGRAREDSQPGRS